MRMSRMVVYGFMGWSTLKEVDGRAERDGEAREGGARAIVDSHEKT